MRKLLLKRPERSSILVVVAVVVCLCANVQAQQRFYVSDSSAAEPAIQYEELPEPQPREPQPGDPKPREPQLMEPQPARHVPIVDVEELAAPSSVEGTRGGSRLSTQPLLPRRASPDSKSIENRLDQLRHRISGAQRSESRRVHKIDEKIDRLKRLLETKPKALLDLAPVDASNTDPSPIPKAKPKNRPETLPSVAPKPVTPQPIGPKAVANAPASIESLIGEAVAVTDKPVDRIALANNLFATGELNLALKIYQSLELSELKSTDQVWIQYQMAGCQRRLGNAKRAHSLYRTVAASKSAPHWANRSRWWLNVMNQTARIKQRQLKAVNTFVQLKEASDELLANNE